MQKVSKYTLDVPHTTSISQVVVEAAPVQSINPWMQWVFYPFPEKEDPLVKYSTRTIELGVKILGRFFTQRLWMSAFFTFPWGHRTEQKGVFEPFLYVPGQTIADFFYPFPVVFVD